MQKVTIKEDIEGIRYCVLVGNERFYQFLEFCNSLQEAKEIAYDYSESNAHHGIHNEEFWAFDTKKWKAYLPKYFEQNDQQFNPNLPIYIEGDDGRNERFINYINRLVNNRKDESIMVKKLNLRESDDKITAKSFDELISKLKRHGYDCKDCYEGDEYLYLRKNGDPYQAEYYKKNDGTYELYLGNIHPAEEKNEGCCGKKCKSESVRTRRVSRRNLNEAPSSYEVDAYKIRTSILSSIQDILKVLNDARIKDTLLEAQKFCEQYSMASEDDKKDVYYSMREIAASLKNGVLAYVRGIDYELENIQNIIDRNS